MKDENDISQDAENDKEDFFSFESEEEPDEEIIELVDIVSENEEIDISRPDQIEKLFEEDDLLEDVETDLDSALQSLELSDEDDKEFDFTEIELEEALKEDAIGEEAIETKVFEHEEIQETETFDETSDVPIEDIPQKVLDENFEADIDITQPEIAVPENFPEQEGLTGISEEKIEAIITKVALDVMEKVAKETIAPIVEKVIVDAIEAFKESLESSQE